MDISGKTKKRKIKNNMENGAMKDDKRNLVRNNETTGKNGN